MQGEASCGLASARQAYGVVLRRKHASEGSTICVAPRRIHGRGGPPLGGVPISQFDGRRELLRGNNVRGFTEFHESGIGSAGSILEEARCSAPRFGRIETFGPLHVLARVAYDASA